MIGINTMTKEGYTHIIVSKELHAFLKREAKAKGISISEYITEALSLIQSISGFISNESGINTTKNFHDCMNSEVQCHDIVPRGFEPLSQAPKAGMLDRYTTGLPSLLYHLISIIKKLSAISCIIFL
jgi:hypothetical protein